MGSERKGREAGWESSRPLDRPSSQVELHGSGPVLHAEPDPQAGAVGLKAGHAQQVWTPRVHPAWKADPARIGLRCWNDAQIGHAEGEGAVDARLQVDHRNGEPVDTL